MKFLPFSLCIGCVLTAIVAGSWVTSARSETPAVKPTAKAAFEDVRPIVDKYCVKCHTGIKGRGGLALDGFKDQASVLKKPKVWEKVSKYLRGGMMPPAGKPKPTPAELDTLYAWLDDGVLKVDCTTGKKDPGRVTIRRLNRAEYDNTIRDLVGVAVRPAEDFPSDDVGYGFDNIGDVLSMPPILTEKYLAAAEKVVDAAWKSDEARKRILICQPADKKENRECARKILQAFANRAWRRPATDEEVKRLLRFVEAADKNGEPFETGVQFALEAVLTSPHFLFRVEIDKEKGEASHPISDWELATRLSYFLWSSMPDEELFNHARKSDLHSPEVLEGQARRMLKDPKAHALVENFADQWLLIRNLKSATPDTALFPSFDEPLRRAMQKETELYFENVVREDRSIIDFIDSDYTFINERLAKHYDIDGVKGDEFRKVTLKDGRRGGVLTQASILTVTSNPTRTSPVKRGKFILDNILGTPPPPPPPDVPALKEGKAIAESASLRQRMEQHRSNPACASCHQKMDPLGFGFENFDAVGAWRERDGKNAIDPAGVLPDGATFKGPAELKSILKGREKDFTHCLTEKMIIYALGRGLERPDRCVVDEVTRGVVQNKYAFSSLVLGIVKSEPFLMRRGK
jgi:Protein of unknown function (DUF1592)/Protein of unknown function (DUF1588)/Protein of unknown function (DUF1587)/Protein of unknown function (DUF1595)/Protein of unknown function (DUF1585)/Cytochrome C oxidase, cbb3-type, subunit III